MFNIVELHLHVFLCASPSTYSKGLCIGLLLLLLSVSKFGRGIEVRNRVILETLDLPLYGIACVKTRLLLGGYGRSYYRNRVFN